MRGPAGAALVAAVVLSLAACGSEQDPGVDGSGATRPSSQTLPPCPDGGPDATTPAAGCLDPDGEVVRP